MLGSAVFSVKKRFSLSDKNKLRQGHSVTDQITREVHFNHLEKVFFGTRSA